MTDTPLIFRFTSVKQNGADIFPANVVLSLFMFAIGLHPFDNMPSKNQQHQKAIKNRKPAYVLDFQHICGFTEWRRWRDSNSRTAFGGYTISNRAPSTN
jgi:hypothetical protein